MTQKDGSKKIGLMGGTFDPIHIGHLLLGREALEELSLDEILFMPTGCSYLKEGRKVADREDRYEMARLAIRGEPSFAVSRMEIDRPGNTYTAETLTLLHEEQPDTSWYLLMGADSLKMLDKWVRPEVICELATLVCAVRGDEDHVSLKACCDALKEKYDARTQILSLGRLDLSSSQIRARIADGLSVRYMVPDAVLSYIDEHGLYRE